MNHHQRLEIRDRLKAAFQTAAKERNTRPSHGPGNWIEYEREMMHEAVTKERAKLGKGPIPITRVERVESMAAGHVDYSDKWPLYCAELVLDMDVVP